MKQELVLWQNCKIYNFEDKNLPLHYDSMLSKNGKIIWLGLQQSCPKELLENNPIIIPCAGKVLTPGFIDCHTHLVFAGNRTLELEARLAGNTYAAIHQKGKGIYATVESTRKESYQNLLAQSLKRLSHLIQQGVTSIEIKSGYGLDFETEKKILRVAQDLAKQTGVTIVKTYLGAHALSPEFENKSAYIDYIIKNSLPELVRLNLIDAVDAYCESLAFSKEELITLFRAAQSLNIPVKLHVDQFSHTGGCALAVEFKALSIDHLEYTPLEDIKKLSTSNTVAVLLPGPYYFLREKQLPPIEMLRALNIPIAIGTDANPGTSPTTSFLFIMNMACILFGLTAQEVLLGVTKYAAKALGLKNCGQLELGYNADCVLWDIEHPRELIFQLYQNPCLNVFKHGRLIYASNQN